MIINKLRKLKLFQMLEDSDIERLANISSIKRLRRDNILFFEGEKARYFYLLLEGHLKLYKTDSKANEIVIHYFTQPSFIAEMVALENMKFPATAIVMSDELEIVLIEKESFLKILKSDANFSFNLIKSLTMKVKQLELVIDRNMVYDAMTKVCSFVQTDPLFVQNAKNTEIASLLNMAPETLSRILSKLRKLEIIDKQNRVLDNDKLKALLEV